jgi:TrmH family RNA methyltransferase
MEFLRSPDNPALARLKLLLRDGAARRGEGRALAEGPHLASEALAAGLARALWATEEAMAGPDAAGLLKAAAAAGVRVRGLSAGLFNRLADTRSPQGWLCEVELRRPEPVPKGDLFLALDALQDPGNLGTLLRCAWAAKAGVILGAGCADPWAPKVLRAGAGAQFHIDLREAPDLGLALKDLASGGVHLWATAPRASKSYLNALASEPCCWVLGSEGAGLNPDLVNICEESFRITYPGNAESLNVAVSGAILLFDALRQRN